MRIALTAAILAAFLLPATAKDGRDWGHDPATSEWFRSLKSPTGVSCCDYADGVRIEDPEWREIDDGEYQVFAKGEWHTIDAQHVITGTNRVGYAILWWPNGWPHPSCFLPGSRG